VGGKYEGGECDKEQLKRVREHSPENQGLNLALTVLYVPYLLGRRASSASHSSPFTCPPKHTTGCEGIFGPFPYPDYPGKGRDELLTFGEFPREKSGN